MPICYVTTPFGVRSIDDQRVDFDAIYSSCIKPAAELAGFECQRADEINTGPIIHKAMFWYVMNSDIMIADITGQNANVIYEIGLRHALSPLPTVIMLNQSRQPSLPFDLNYVFSFSYSVLEEYPAPGEQGEITSRLADILHNANSSHRRFGSPLYDIFPGLRVQRPKAPCVFIGHGHSRLWRSVRNFIENDLKLKVVTYETEARAGLSITSILEDMLEHATFAVLVLTAEDETGDKTFRARQNVIHEAGMFQGVLGFRKAILLLQKGVEEYSNVDGLQYLEFSGERIDSTFFELERTIKREGLIL